MNINCENCRAEMDDYLYGELDGVSSAAIRAHLDSCSACSAIRDGIERENALFAMFNEQTQIEPSPRSWMAVRDRIREESVVRTGITSATAGGNETFFARLVGWIIRPAVLQQVAFAAALILVSVATTLYFVRRQGPAAPADGLVAVRETPLPDRPVPSPSPAQLDEGVEKGKPVQNRINRSVKAVSERDLLAIQVARAEREYLSAIKLLDRAIARRRDEVDPDVMKQYETSLALIDQSIEASRNAYRQNRADFNVSQFLIAAYSRKVELMQDIAMR